MSALRAPHTLALTYDAGGRAGRAARWRPSMAQHQQSWQCFTASNRSPLPPVAPQIAWLVAKRRPEVSKYPINCIINDQVCGLALQRWVLQGRGSGGGRRAISTPPPKVAARGAGMAWHGMRSANHTPSRVMSHPQQRANKEHGTVRRVPWHDARRALPPVAPCQHLPKAGRRGQHPRPHVRAVHHIGQKEDRRVLKPRRGLCLLMGTGGPQGRAGRPGVERIHQQSSCQRRERVHPAPQVTRHVKGEQLSHMQGSEREPRAGEGVGGVEDEGLHRRGGGQSRLQPQLIVLQSVLQPVQEL